MMLELKDFSYVGAMQGHSIIHGNGMNSKEYSSVDNKLVYGLTDRSMHALLLQADEGFATSNDEHFIHH